MDPIHPIIPQAPNLPPVAPAPRLTRVDRDAGRQDDPGRRRRPKRQPPAPAPSEPLPGDEDAAGPHIDVTA